MPCGRLQGRFLRGRAEKPFHPFTCWAASAVRLFRSDPPTPGLCRQPCATARPAPCQPEPVVPVARACPPVPIAARGARLGACPLGPHARSARACWLPGSCVPARTHSGPWCPAGCVPGGATRPLCPRVPCPPVRSAGHTLRVPFTLPPNNGVQPTLRAQPLTWARLFTAALCRQSSSLRRRSAADADVGLSLYGLRSAWAAMGLYQLWVVSLMVGTAYLI